MADYTEEDCPKCGQKLRFPNNVGGIVMKCPECGQRFHSDFKIGGGKGSKRAVDSNIFISLFEFPSRLIAKIVRLFKN